MGYVCYVIGCNTCILGDYNGSHVLDLVENSFTA